MPTGYTDKLYRGEDQTPGEFLMDCARAFGALVQMRDSDRDAKIPDTIEPSHYHAERLAELKEEQAEFLALSDEELEAACQDEYDAKEQNRLRALKERDELRGRYQQMVLQINDWEPPTADHRKLKEFAMEQLTSSISFDTGGDYYETPTERQDWREWAEKKRERFERDIKHHEQENREEIERAETRTKWIRDLREGLPKEEVPA